MSSSFFRSAADISSSREESSSEDESTDTSDSRFPIARIHTLGSSTAGEHSESSVNDTFTEASRKPSYHRDVLLHALLEERCINEALEDLRTAGINVDSRNHPQVRALAGEKYTTLCQKLENYGLLAGDLNSEQLGPLRQTYRDGLTLLTRTSARPPMEDMLVQDTVSVPLLRLLNGDPGDVNLQLENLALTNSGFARPNPLSGVLPGHPLLHSTRYTRDFEEFGILGKGGYGTVFRAKHNLDGRQYAVKKIPLGPTRMRRIQENGQAELDNILVEVRTLARLEHPNIVRYQSGWIEWAPLMVSGKQKLQVNGRKLLGAPRKSSEKEVSGSFDPNSTAPTIDVQFGYDEDDLGLSSSHDPRQRFATQDEEQVLFEDSTRDSHTQSLNPNPISDAADLQKVPTRSTIASVSDESESESESEIEIITRGDDPSSSFDSSFTSGQAPPSEPSLALHIQMSLYSMTLSDYLAPSVPDAEADPIFSLRHCFHAPASLEILSSILEGVEYLHSEEIVHRDLKPGNIFLSVRPASKRRPASINLPSCDDCTDALQKRPYSINVCIGDFGLVSAIARPEDAHLPPSTSKAVGTEIYRPDVVTRDNHPSLDVFALGVVAFELVWRFGTRMERFETLRALKKAEFPDNFETEVKCEGLKEWIKTAVEACERSCPTWDELRGGLEDMLGRYGR